MAPKCIQALGITTDEVRVSEQWLWSFADPTCEGLLSLLSLASPGTRIRPVSRLTASLDFRPREGWLTMLELVILLSICRRWTSNRPAAISVGTKSRFWKKKGRKRFSMTWTKIILCLYSLVLDYSERSKSFAPNSHGNFIKFLGFKSY